MNEKTTIYLDPKVKEDTKIKLIREFESKSLSALVNELLEQWLKLHD
jgi:hypothetical protein